MNKAMQLKESLGYLFRTGADETHTVKNMTSLLDSIDYHLLLQSLMNDQETVYQYMAHGSSDEDMIYYGPKLFKGKAVLLYEDLTEFSAESCLCTRTLELWLLDNMRFAVASCFIVTLLPQRYVSEYRTFKGMDWRRAGMLINFSRLAADLEERCGVALTDKLPVYEI